LRRDFFCFARKKGGEMAAKSGEKSSFAVACNLLSNYIKQKGGVADLGLGITSRPLENSKGARFFKKRKEILF
jgi:hypothetical protein